MGGREQALPPGANLSYRILNTMHLRKVLIEQNLRLCEEHMYARLISADTTRSLMQTNRVIANPQQTNMQTSQSQKVIIEKRHTHPPQKKNHQEVSNIYVSD